VRGAAKAQRAAGPASVSPGLLPNATTQIPSGAPSAFRFLGADKAATSERRPMLRYQEPSMLGTPSSHASVSGSQRGSIDSTKTPDPEQVPAHGRSSIICSACLSFKPRVAFASSILGVI
jgi:hypothetical protein